MKKFMKVLFVNAILFVLATIVRKSTSKRTKYYKYDQYMN